MSVTIRPSTESPRNSRRSFVTSRACSNANDRWVSAASRRPGSRKATPSAASSAPPGTASGDPTWLLDLGRVVARALAEVAVAAARRAQALAIGAAQRCERHLHADRVADDLIAVDLLVDEGVVVVVRVVGVGRDRRDQLRDLDGERSRLVG